MQTYSFCQTTYPAKMISQQGDTIVAITVPQLKVINRTINGYVHLKEINEYLVKKNDYSDEIIRTMEVTLSRKDSVLLLTEQKYRVSTDYINYLNTSIKETGIKNRRNLFRVGIVSVSVGAIIGILVK